MAKRKRINTVYEHIWRSIAAVVALVFIIGGTMIVYYMDRSMTAQIEKQEAAYLEGVDTFLDHHIASAQQTLNMLLTNPFVVQSVYTGNVDWNTTTYQSGQTIVNAVNSNQAYNSIYVIGGSEIAIKSSRRYQTREDEAMLIDSMRMNFRQALIPWRSTLGARSNNNLMVQSALDAVAIPNETGGALINLDLDRLADMAFVNHGSRTVYLVLNEQVIASSDDSALFTPMADVALLSKAVSTQKQLIDGHYVFSFTNPTYGYTLYSVQSHSALMTPVKTGLGFVLLIISVLLLVTMLISRRAALLAYTPVKTVLIQLEEQLPAGGDASGEELSDLQRASRSIRRTSEIVSAYRHDADTARLSRFIHGGAEDAGIVQMLEAQLGYHGQEYLCMLMFQAEAVEDAHMAADVLQGYMNGYARFLTLDMPGQRLLSLCCMEPSAALEPEVLTGSVEQIVQLMQTQGAGNVFVVKQAGVDGVDMLPAAYIQLVERLRSHVFCSGSAFLAEPVNMELPPEMTQGIIEAAQEPEADVYQQAVADMLVMCSRMTAREAYHQLATLCMRIAETASRHSLNVADRLDSYRSIHNALFALKDYQAVMTYMQNLQQTVIAQGGARRSGESNPLADNILAYMTAHYHDASLSAVQVADALGVSVSHLSRVMNRSIGCGFPEMLQKLRLEHAVELLVEKPDLSIAQLAQQCGFSSASYFTASFKRVYGVTPSVYRSNQG